MSDGRRRVKPLNGSSASLRPLRQAQGRGAGGMSKQREEATGKTYTISATRPGGRGHVPAGPDGPVAQGPFEDRDTARYVIEFVLGFLRDIQRRFETAVPPVLRARKGGATKPGQALRGSSELQAWGDSNLHLRRRDRQILMTVGHRAAPGLNDIEIELADHGKGPVLRLRQLDTADAALRPETPERRLLQALAVADAPPSQRQIRERAATRCRRWIMSEAVCLADAAVIWPKHVPLGGQFAERVSCPTIRRTQWASRGVAHPCLHGHPASSHFSAGSERRPGFVSPRAALTSSRRRNDNSSV